MESPVLLFPTDPTYARRSRLHAASSALPLEEAPPEAKGQHRLQLVFSRPRRSGAGTPDTRTQAQRIAEQVERELAGRVEREATERRSEPGLEFRAPFLAERRTLASRMPIQATEIGLRHRLLDALLFFARPTEPHRGPRETYRHTPQLRHPSTVVGRASCV